MGGSGGGGWYRGGGGGGASRAFGSALSAQASSESYEAEANSFLQGLLSTYNDRPTDIIRDRLADIQSSIDAEVEGSTSLLFGGSVKRHTYVDGLSDVDALLVLNRSSLAAASPQEVLSFAEDRLRDSLGPDVQSVKAGSLAVTVTYWDGAEIQVLPALRTQTGVRIANVEGGWTKVVRPERFAQKLTQVNQQCGTKVVPTIKLFKGLQSALPENCRLKGYHAESLAIEAFKSYDGARTLRAMLQHLVSQAATRVLNPIQDRTGQSRHVDDYLGAANSAERHRVAASLSRVAQRLSSAEAAKSTADLRSVFGE